MITPAYRLFNVTISGHSEPLSSTYSALTRSKALYQAWLDYRDPFPCTFLDFMKRAKCCQRSSPLAARAFDIAIGPKGLVEREERRRCVVAAILAWETHRAMSATEIAAAAGGLDSFGFPRVVRTQAVLTAASEARVKEIESHG